MLFVLVLLPINSFSQSCEENLSDCRNILGEASSITYFSNHSTQQDFISWWSKKWIHGKPLGIIKADYILGKIEPSYTDKTTSTYTIPGDKGISIILVIPSEKLEDEHSYKCYSNKSILRSSLEDGGLPINLNPNCSEIYGPDEVNITLYWMTIDKKPLVEIETNGPACVPAMLYQYNEKANTYKLVAEKCGG